MKKLMLLACMVLVNAYSMEKEKQPVKEKEETHKKDKKQKKPSAEYPKTSLIKHEKRHNSEPAIALQQLTSSSKAVKKSKSISLRRLSADFTALLKRDEIKQGDNEDTKEEQKLMAKIEKANTLTPRTKEKIYHEIIVTETRHVSLVKEQLARDEAEHLMRKAELAIGNMEAYSKNNNIEEMIAAEDIYFKYRYEARPVLIEQNKAQYPEKKEYRIQGMADEQLEHLRNLYKEAQKRMRTEKKGKDDDKANP